MNNLLLLQSDFGLVDGAVAAMQGVSKIVARDIEVYNLTHDIPPFNIWEGSYRLFQTLKFWPVGTTFVSVVDPGVGSARQSVVCKTKCGSYIVTPNNGTLTHINNFIGIEEMRIIDESKHRLEGSADSHTFHGRDVSLIPSLSSLSPLYSLSSHSPLSSLSLYFLHYFPAFYCQCY